MNFKLFFSVLQYIPSPIRDERINIGIVFHIPELEFSTFKSIKRLSRLKKFDDEYDSEYYKAIIDTFHEDLDFKKEDLHLSFNVFSDISSDNFLYKRINNYANEFRFKKVKVLLTNSDEYENDINSLYETYLYYDTPRSKRIDNKEIISLLSRQLRIKNPGDKITKNPNDYLSPFGQKNIFDFSVKNEFYSTLSFDYKRKTDLESKFKEKLFDIQSIYRSQNNPYEKMKINIVTDNGNSESYESLYKEFTNYIKNNFDRNQHYNIYIYKISDVSEGKNDKIV